MLISDLKDFRKNMLKDPDAMVMSRPLEMRSLRQEEGGEYFELVVLDQFVLIRIFGEDHHRKLGSRLRD